MTAEVVATVATVAGVVVGDFVVASEAGVLLN